VGQTLPEQIVALFEERKYSEVERLARRMTVLVPREGFGWKALATVLGAQGKWEKALAVYRRSAALLDGDAEFQNNFGNALKAVGRFAEAEVRYRRAVALKPEYAEAWDHLGVVLHQMERLDEAETALLRAIVLRPGFGEAYAHLGNLLLIECRIPEAETSYRKALALLPGSAQVQNNLGSLLHGAGRYQDAEACFRRALTLDPQYAPAYNSLGHLMASHGFHAEAEACFRYTLVLQPDHAVAHSNLLFSIAHRSEVTPEALLAEHLAFRERFETPLRSAWRAHGNDRDPERVLRVGFVSGDLHDHAVVRYLRPVLECLQAYPELVLCAYSNGRIEDSVTAQLKMLFAEWRHVSFLSDVQLAEQIRADGIDIVIDLAGHTGYNRLLALARKPAPLQMGWIGYVGTTGLEAMDYFIADRNFIPQELAGQFTEKLLYLPACTPFAPYAHAPAVNALPALENGCFTFGSFNRINKLSREVIALWSEILQAAPGTRLLLAAMPDATPPELLLRWFAEERIAPERLTFLGARGVEATLRLHHQVDLCLDPFPYNGSTTNNHALWMGVPTLTLPGLTAPGRMGASLALHVGLTEFIAADKRDYIAKAVYWAGQWSELAVLRGEVRARFAQSIFLQPEVITAALVRGLRSAWRRWCDGLGPEHIDAA
jgi:predicted O-linked N-acetylglucosamine transferase (SPINDLY family)